MDEQHRVIGIDFGTTNSVMAWVNPRTGQPEVIKNAEGEEKTPSVVYFSPEGVVVGKSAEFALVDAENWTDEVERQQVLQSIFCSVKRDLGKRLLRVLPDGRRVRPIDIASEVFKKLKRDAEELLFHETLERAVVTHPTAFGPTERDAIRQAAQLAGFNEVTLLEEPIAAAMGHLACGLEVHEGIIVYDLGGGTFDLAYTQLVGDGQFRTPLPPMGDSNCGGDDIDQQLYDYLDEQAQSQGMSLYSKNGEVSRYHLHKCRECKEQLSSMQRSGVRVFIPEAHPTSRQYPIERSTLEGLLRPVISRTVNQTQELIRRVEQEKLPLEQVVMIGGSTRSPIVRNLLQAALPAQLHPRQTIFTDNAVALGAAVFSRPKSKPEPARPAAQPTAQPAVIPPQAPVSTALKNDGPIMRTIKAFMTRDEWPFQVVEGKPILTSAFQGNNGSWKVLCNADEKNCQAMFLSVLNIKAPEAKRKVVNEFLSRANFGMDLGVFEMDFEDGEIRMRTSIDVEGNTLEEKQVSTLLYTSVAMMDRYYPGLMAVMYGNKTPKDACREAEAKK